MFTQDELISIARNLHKKENNLLLQPMKKSPYSNDLGNFSFQVIEEALGIFEIKLLRLEKNAGAIQNAKAFIIHLNSHWIALRKFGNDWIDLDSTLSQPKPLPRFNINSYIKSKKCRTTVFIVEGILADFSQVQVGSPSMDVNPIFTGNKASTKGKNLKKITIGTSEKNVAEAQVGFIIVLLIFYWLFIIPLLLLHYSWKAVNSLLATQEGVPGLTRQAQIIFQK